MEIIDKREYFKAIEKKKALLRIERRYYELEQIGWLMPKGECEYCDKEREAQNLAFPPHKSSKLCKSGNRNHCTCDACF